MRLLTVLTSFPPPHPELWSLEGLLFAQILSVSTSAGVGGSDIASHAPAVAVSGGCPPPVWHCGLGCGGSGSDVRAWEGCLAAGSLVQPGRLIHACCWEAAN